MRGRIWLATLLAIARRAHRDARPRPEADVVVYTAIENEQITDYMKALNKTHPNLDVKILRLSTGDISARFMAEKDNMQADVIWGVGATNQLIFKNAGLLEPYAPKGLERIQPLFRDKANPPVLGGHRHLHVGLLLQHRRREEEQPAQAGVVGRPHQARLQGPRGDAEPGQLGHGVSLGRLHPAAHGRGGGLEVSRRAERQHRRVHEVRLQALQGRGGGGAGHRRVVRVRRARDEEEGQPGGDGAAQGGLGLRDGGQRPHQEGREEPRAPSSSWTGRRATRRWRSTPSTSPRWAWPASRCRRACPRTSARWSIPNDFDWSAKNRERILAEWSKRYAK